MHIAIKAHSLPQSRVGSSFGQHGISADIMLASPDIAMTFASMEASMPPDNAMAGVEIGARISPRIASAESKCLIVNAFFTPSIYHVSRGRLSGFPLFPQETQSRLIAQAPF